MPRRLILLNGPPGCGKSTLAQRYVDEHPPALNLDLDRVRSLIGRWRERPQEAGPLARDIALAMARTHLLAGHEVVIPQYLGRLPFIQQVERLAADANAQFLEVVLLDTKENSLRRFEQRTAAAADPAHLEAQAMVDRSGGPLLNGVSIPLLLSGILLPMSLAPTWLYNLSRTNPLAYMVDAARDLFAGDLTTRPVALGFAVTLACTVLAAVAAVRTFQRESG